MVTPPPTPQEISIRTNLINRWNIGKRSTTVKTNTSTATGRVQVATGISSTSLTTDVGVAWNSKDNANAITSLGTPDKTAGLNNSTSITVSKGNQ